MRLEEKFENIYLKRNGRKEVWTENLDPGHKVYGERLVKYEGREYRVWDPTRSKLAALILKGARKIPIQKDSKILYLGSATGTTCSHLSDIVTEGIIYGVDVSPRVMRDFIRVCRRRENLVPILADARNPKSYSNLLEEVGVLYCDVAQRDMTDIFLKNSRIFLKRGGSGILMIKASSIDVTKKPAEIYERESKKLEEKEFKILERKKLDPFQKKHAALVCGLKG